MLCVIQTQMLVVSTLQTKGTYNCAELAHLIEGVVSTLQTKGTYNCNHYR